MRNVRCHACDGQTDGQWKVMQYSVWTESAKETVVALQNGGKRLRVPIMHTRDRKRNEKCTMMDNKMKSSQWKKRSTVHKEEKKKRPIVLNKEISDLCALVISDHQCTMCTLFSMMPLYLLWPCSHYNKKKGWIQGHIWGRRGGYRDIFRGKSRI